MFWNPSAGDIFLHWHKHIEQKVEEGVTPILDLGASSLTTQSTASLLALQLLAARRVDAAHPVVTVGGPGATWLAALLQPAAPRQARGVVQPAVLFTGIAPVEHMASLALLGAALDARAADGAGAADLAAPIFQPQSRPGAPTPWETLPFVQAGIDASALLLVPPTDGASAAEPTADWLAWAALLLALLLVILAILL